MLLTIASGLLLLLIFRNKPDLLKIVLIVLTFTIARIFFASAWKSLTPGIDTIVTSASFCLLLSYNFLIISVAFILTVNHLTKHSFSTLGWTKTKITRNILLGIIVSAPFFLLLTFNKPIKYQTLFPALFFAFLIASWQEENIFRGYLMGYLAHKFDTPEAVIYQALIYSLAHIGFYPFSSIVSLLASLVFAFVLGLVFGLLRHAAKSQIPAFVAHAIIDIAFLAT